jgi:hypothetical protein
MSFPRSWVGFLLATVYLVPAVWVVRDELRRGGGWINLRWLGTMLVTAPSQATLGLLLQKLRVPRVNFDRPGVSGYAQLVTHVAITALTVYLIGWALEWLVRGAIA